MSSTHIMVLLTLKRKEKWVIPWRVCACVSVSMCTKVWSLERANQFWCNFACRLPLPKGEPSSACAVRAVFSQNKGSFLWAYLNNDYPHQYFDNTLSNSLTCRLASIPYFLSTSPTVSDILLKKKNSLLEVCLSWGWGKFDILQPWTNMEVLGPVRAVIFFFLALLSIAHETTALYFYKAQ